jgi:hypothetical protein
MHDHVPSIRHSDLPFVADKSLVGLGLHMAEAGDVVAVMAGILVPCIPRPLR